MVDSADDALFNAFYIIPTTFYIRFYPISTQHISDIDVTTVLPPKTGSLQINNFLIRQL